MKRRIRPFRSLLFVCFLFYMIWLVLLFLAPLMIPAGSVPDLSGVVGSVENDAVINDLSFPWNVVYSVGDRLCHQRSERSLYINGNEMPFCTRCTAIWLGLAIGLGWMVFYTIELTEKFVYVILLALLPIGVDGVGQLLRFWESTNVLRLLTGLPAGIICGVALGIIYDEVRSFQVFKKTKTT
ncbi:MAG: DUF2085 domain-containing protein [Candidatus Thermoplasmatota archaeon]